MTRAEFIARLTRGLSGASPAERAEVIADYEAHFDEAIAAGRTEPEAAAALGDPVRLARELRAETGLKRWEDRKTPSNALGAVWALLGLGALDLIILVPLLMSVISTLISFYIAAIVAIIAGGVVMVAGPFITGISSPWIPVLCGLGAITASAAVIALLTIISIGIVNASVWYGRLHLRLLKPAMEQA